MLKTKDGYAKLVGTAYTGNANYLLKSDGGVWEVHTDRNNGANKIVRTDASGYLQTGWINTTSGDMGTTAATRIYCSYDGYIRYKTPANITVGNADKLDGIHANGLFTDFSYNNNSQASATIGGTTKTADVVGSKRNVSGNMNDAATWGNTIGMINLSTPSGGTAAYINPNGQTGWHHFINMSYNVESNNMWQTQIANAVGSCKLWVRSRNGGAISNTAAWAKGWVRILTGEDSYVSNGEGYLNGTKITKVDTLTTARTISLTNSASGSASFNGSANISISTTVLRLDNNTSTTASDPGGLTWLNISGTAGCAVSTNDTPTSSWWYILRNRHTNTSNNYYTDVAIPFNDASIYYKIVRNNELARSPYNKWVKVFDENNWASYVTWSTLPGKPSTFAPSAHDHSRVLDVSNSSATTFAYSKSGLNYGDFTWLAAWNGYELRAVNKSLFAAAHDHPYIRTYSGTDVNVTTTYGYYGVMTTQSGITSSWWHVLQMDWNGGASWRSQLALPTQHRNGVYYRSDNAGTTFSAWVKLLDENNYIDYTVTKTGYGASGTWDINISGIAARASIANNLSIAHDSVYANDSDWAVSMYYDGTFNQFLDTEGHQFYADIAGKVKIYQNNSSNTDYPIVWSGSNSTSDDVRGYLYKSYANLTYNPSTGIMKAGTILPTASGKYLGNSSNIWSGVYANNVVGKNQVYISTIYATSAVMITGDKLGIAMNPTYELDIYGSGRAINWYTTSDIRYKTVLESVNISSEILSKIPLFKYIWNEKFEVKDPNTHIGSSAQAVMTILPELVSKDEDRDFYNLDYSTLGVVAGITACKELVMQKSEIEVLKERIEELERKLSKYE